MRCSREEDSGDSQEEDLGDFDKRDNQSKRRVDRYLD